MIHLFGSQQEVGFCSFERWCTGTEGDIITPAFHAIDIKVPYGHAEIEDII